LRRINHAPLAYILGKKEFYGLEFKVDKNTLIPRPETEMLVELASCNIKHGTWNKKNKLFAVDVGTGSGNIIISIVKALASTNQKLKTINYFGIDISSDALKIARQNAKIHKVDKKIKFIQGNLLEPFLKANKLTKLQPEADPPLAEKPNKLVIVANLPYLSKKIYVSSLDDVKKYEPKSALYSPQDGLWHYKKLLEQIKKIHDTCYMIHATCILEISPEQKKTIAELIGNTLPFAKIGFEKDLADKWRICQVTF